MAAEEAQAVRSTELVEEGVALPATIDFSPGGTRRALLHHQTTVTDFDEATPLTTMRNYMLFPAEESVYSYFTFMAPIEQRRTGKFITPLLAFAMVLVLVNFVMQTGLLYVVGGHIMHKHVNWVSKVAHLKNHAWYHVMPMPYNEPLSKCRGKNSPLCFDHGDGLDCSPLSLHLLTNWELLDSDGDGIWAQEEADDEKLREKVVCEYDVDLPSLYTNIVRHINESSSLQGRRDTNLLTGVAVHKAYLNWYLHKPLLCMYGDHDMCGALFQRGFFDEALRQKSSSEFVDAASALKYCHNLLQYECLDILPNTYRVWRSVSNQQCGEKIFGQIDFHNPADAVPATILGRNPAETKDSTAITPMLSVDFRKRQEYATTRTPHFRLFLAILLITFLSVMALEMRSISKSFIWCAMFPADDVSHRDGRVVGREAVHIRFRGGTGSTHMTSASHMTSAYGGASNRSNVSSFKRMSLDTVSKIEEDLEEEELSEDEADIQKVILGVRWDHRFLVGLMTLLRFLLWCFLMWSGIMFLTGPPRYLTLIFDALSLVFIFEIDELLYRTMLRHEFKKDHESIQDMKVPQWHGGRVSGWLGVLADMAWFFAVIILGIAIVYTYCQKELNPLLDSLECLCTVTGPQCFSAQHYSKAWWDTYWTTMLPAANLIIDQLKLI